MLKKGLIGIALLSLAGCSGMLGAVSHPEIIITEKSELTVLTLDPYKGAYQIVTPDTTIRMSGELPEGMMGFWPTNAEMADMGVRALPSRNAK